MAVKTSFSKEDFKQILSNYNLGEYQDYKPIAQGTVQTNISIQTNRDKYIFRYYENRSKEAVLFETNLIRYLNSKNYPCPIIYADKKGIFVGDYQGKPFAIFEFVEGQHLENPNEDQKKQLIEKVALLQNITKDYDPPFKKARWNYSIELCEKLVPKIAKKIKTAEAQEKLRWFENELSKIELPESLPKGICHCDFHFSNILFKDGQFKALIDFDDANYTYLSYDLMTLINPFISSFNWDSWPSFKKDDEIFDFNDSRKVVQEYMRHRELTEDEKIYAYDLFKLSIMIDCLWYFKRGFGDFYEKRKMAYLNLLGRQEFYNQLFNSNS